MIKALRLMGIVVVLAASALSANAQQAPGFVDVAGETGIIRIKLSTWSANVADYNGDGKQDWLLVRHYPKRAGAPDGIPRPILYANAGGRFDEVPVDFNSADRHDCDWGDTDDDGDLDLFCAVGLGSSSPNELWLQSGDGFTKAAPPGWGQLNDPIQGRSRTATFLNANGDALPDLFVNRYNKINLEGDTRPDRFFVNSGSELIHAPEWGVNQTFGTIHGVKTCNDDFDYNLDGRDDLLVCTSRVMKLWENTGTTFVNRSKELGVGGHFLDAELQDLDGVGRPDLVRINKFKVMVRLATATGFAPATIWDVSSSGVNLATGDYDGDGDLDVYVQRACIKGPTLSSIDDQSDWVLTNDGSGNFTLDHEMAGVSEGCGQSVERIDYNQDGRDEFIVLNGKENSQGFVQLLTHEP